jgi:hypothetical protein
LNFVIIITTTYLACSKHGHRGAVTPLVTARAPHALTIDRVNVPPDQLSTAEHLSVMALQDYYLVAEFFETLYCAFWNAIFQVNSLVEDIASVRHAGADAHSGRVERCLRGEVEDQLVQKDLYMALRLHEAAHDAVDAVQALVADVGHQRWDDGVVWPLVRCKDVWVVLWAEREAGATVLQCEATALGHDAGAEAAVVTIDEADAIAFAVGHGEVDSVAVLVGG